MERSSYAPLLLIGAYKTGMSYFSLSDTAVLCYDKRLPEDDQGYECYARREGAKAIDP